MRFLLLLCLPLNLIAFTVEPWFADLGEFYFQSTYGQRRYSKVSQSTSAWSSRDQWVDCNLAVRFLPNWEAQLETHLVKKTGASWGGERIGALVRYLVCSDLTGAPASLILGLKGGYISSYGLKDIGAYAHATSNLEASVAIGKELGGTYYPTWRLFGFLGIGQGNRGHAWVHPQVSIEVRRHDSHRFQWITEGQLGAGKQHTISPHAFNGYGDVRYRYIDTGFRYAYRFKIWGTLECQVMHRLYARVCPKDVIMVRIGYQLPFSIF